MLPAAPLVSLRTFTPLTMICRSSSTEMAVVRSGPPEMIQEVQVAGWGVPVGQAPFVAPGKLANLLLGIVRVTPLSQIVSFLPLPLPAAWTWPCAWVLALPWPLAFADESSRLVRNRAAPTA